MSILAMHWRLFPTHTSSTTKVVYRVLGGLTLTWWVAEVLVTSFKCKPLARTFDPYVEGTCIDNLPFYLGFGIPNIVIDALIMALAIWKVSRLRLPALKRAGLVCVFLFGAGTIVASCVRLLYPYYCDVEIANAETRDPQVTRKSRLISLL